jgi:hypothetical protein
LYGGGTGKPKWEEPKWVVPDREALMELGNNNEHGRLRITACPPPLSPLYEGLAAWFDFLFLNYWHFGVPLFFHYLILRVWHG